MKWQRYIKFLSIIPGLLVTGFVTIGYINNETAEQITLGIGMIMTALGPLISPPNAPPATALERSLS